MRKNNAENYEVICTLKFDRLFAAKFPIVYQAKKEELMEDCGMSEEEAVEAMKDMTVELELYYEKGRGLFAVEAEATECSPIYSPYSREELDDCPGLAEEMEDGRLKVSLYDGTEVYVRESFDIVGIGKERRSIVVEDIDGGIICTIDDVSLPPAEDFDEDYVDLIDREVNGR